MPVTLAPDPTRWVYDAVADMWHCLDEIDLDYWWQQEALREVETMCFDEYQVWRAEETSFEAWSSNKLASIAELEAEIARLQGAQLSHMADLVDRSVGRGTEDEADSQAMSAYAQIGLALEVAPATADKRADEALDLAHRLPRTLAALCAGTITLAKARVIAAETIGLTAEETERVEAKLLTWLRVPLPAPCATRCVSRSRRSIPTHCASARRQRKPNGPSRSTATLTARA